MKAYIVQNKDVVDPFGEHSRDCLIGNKTLAIWQKEILSSLDLDPIFIIDACKIDDSSEYIIFKDNLYFTQELLNEFISESQKQRSSTVCSLKSGITTLRTVIATQKVRVRRNHVEYDLYYFPKEEYREKCYPLVIDPDQISTNMLIPKHMCGTGKYVIPMTEKFIIQINHWVNLWAANIFTLLAKGARIHKMSKIALAFLALKALSLDQWKILRQLNKIGRNCEIHHMAYIEGSAIGDDVTIGAGSIIRESVIGNGVFIGNGAQEPDDF